MFPMSTESAAPVAAGTRDSQARLLQTLRTIDFPATSEDLLRIAIVDDLEAETIDALRALPRRDFHGAAEVLAALRWK